MLSFTSGLKAEASNTATAIIANPEPLKQESSNASTTIGEFFKFIAI